MEIQLLHQHNVQVTPCIASFHHSLVCQVKLQQVVLTLDEVPGKQDKKCGAAELCPFCDGLFDLPNASQTLSKKSATDIDNNKIILLDVFTAVAMLSVFSIPTAKSLSRRISLKP